VLLALHARSLRDQNRSVLHRVEVAPPTLWRVVSTTDPVALRTAKARARAPNYVDANFLVRVRQSTSRTTQGRCGPIRYAQCAAINSSDIRARYRPRPRPSQAIFYSVGDAHHARFSRVGDPPETPKSRISNRG